MTVVSFRRTALVVLAAIGAATSLGGCGSADPSGGDAPTVEIILGNFTISPNVVTMTAGKARLHVTNTDRIPHNLTVAGYGTRNLAPGQEQTLSVKIDAGSYKMWCDVPGHAKMGQTGTLQAVVADMPVTIAS